MKDNPKIKITLENNQEIILELFESIAPVTVRNFLDLVSQGYYNGVCFHRIIDNFMIQAGGYYIQENQIIEKEKTTSIKGEFQVNNHDNNLKHELGVISMARLGNDYNSASSQFFICSNTSKHLDGQYAAFGKTINETSNQVILDLSKAKTQAIDNSLLNFPYPPILIKSITSL